MHRSSTSERRGLRLTGALTVLTGLLAAALCAGAAATGSAAIAPTAQPGANLKPRITWDTAHDVSPPLRVLAAGRTAPHAEDPANEPDRGPISAGDGRSSRDGALQSALLPASIPSTQQNFEGLSNQDNFNIFGFRVNPPDPNGEVGLNNYIEMVNLVFAVYDKSGNRLLGPVDTGTLWSGFAVPDCTEPSGDPVVMYDQITDRWILSQFTTSGLDDPSKPFWNCVAVSTTGDPTGTYYRYAFETKNFQFFPDYPKYGVWTDSYVLTTREFGPTIEYGIGVYALEKNKMVNGQPARAVSFFLDGNAPGMLPLVGDGLLPADIDGKQKPKTDTAVPIVGTQDDNASYGATFDALNIWDLLVKWNSAASSSLTLNTQLPTAAFDSIFPCGPSSRDCLPQPGIVNPAQYLDILSYRQRPTFRLAYRNFKDYEALVTSQSVEATPGVAGEAARVADAGIDGGCVDDAVPETHVALLVHGDASHPAVDAVARCVRALLKQAVRRAGPPDLVPAGTGDARCGLDRLVRDQRLVALEVAVREPERRPLPVGEDVEVLRRIRDARLWQAVTRPRRAREDRVEGGRRQLRLQCQRRARR